MFVLDQLKILSDYSGIESANEIHVRHKEIIVNDVLTFIPGETQDNPLTIAINLPEFCRIPKAGHITDCNKAASTVVETTCIIVLLHNSVSYCFALVHFVMTCN